MKAQDIMIPIQEFLKPDQTLKEAVHLLRAAGRAFDRQDVIGLPVFENHHKLIGILSMWDIIKAVYPSYMSRLIWEASPGTGWWNLLQSRLGLKELRPI